MRAKIINVLWHRLITTNAWMKRVYVCVSQLVCQLYALSRRLCEDEGKMSRSTVGNTRMEDSVGWTRTGGVGSEEKTRGKFLGVQMEMRECNRAFFHECLLKAQSGRGFRGAGSVKVSLQWHVPSCGVLQ